MAFSLGVASDIITATKEANTDDNVDFIFLPKEVKSLEIFNKGTRSML